MMSNTIPKYIGSFKPTTTIQKSDRKKLLKQTLEIQFGFNLKQDAPNKKQYDLWKKIKEKIILVSVAHLLTIMNYIVALINAK